MSPLGPTGAVTLVGPMTGTTNVSPLTFHLAGQAMYAVDNLQDQQFRLDLATGTPTLLGPVGFGNMIGLVSLDVTAEDFDAFQARTRMKKGRGLLARGANRAIR